MEYLTIAYVLIAVVLIGYGVSLWQRRQAIERERARLEARDE
jgi:hypothetical protein